MSEQVVQLTESSFEQKVLRSPQPVLVDFWAEWCMPCRFLAPVVESVAKEYASKVTVGKLNVDEHPAIAAQYGITGIPTLLLFKNGKVVESVVGVVPKEQIVKLINKHVLAAVA